MQSFMNFWEHIQSWQRMAILLGGMVFFWLIEGYYPLFAFSWKRYKHAGVNLIFLLTTIILNLLLGAVTILACKWVTTNHFGLWNWLHLPLWANIIVALFFMDFFGAYCIHIVEHKVKWMWKFHMIHHADTHVDTTTANRHHPGESVFRAVFAIIAILITGAPIWMVMLYQTLSVALAQFNHANIKMNTTLDKTLRLIFVTPNMHRVHHHYVRPETDSNYGNIFSLWDRMFGTYLYKPTNELKFGLDVLKTQNDQSIKDQLVIPFDKKIKTDF